MVSINLRGELTVTVEEEKDLLEYSLIQKMAKMMKISSAEVKFLSSAVNKKSYYMIVTQWMDNVFVLLWSCLRQNLWLAVAFSLCDYDTC